MITIYTTIAWHAHGNLALISFSYAHSPHRGPSPISSDEEPDWSAVSLSEIKRKIWLLCCCRNYLVINLVMIGLDRYLGKLKYWHLSTGCFALSSLMSVMFWYTSWGAFHTFLSDIKVFLPFLFNVTNFLYFPVWYTYVKVLPHLMTRVSAPVSCLM